MNTDDSNDREIERLLEAHFASRADNAPPTPELWVWLEGRLGDQTPRPFWAGLRDRAFPAGGFRGAVAATVAVAVVVAASGAVWFVVGGSGAGVVPAGPGGGLPGPSGGLVGPSGARTPSANALSQPMATMAPGETIAPPMHEPTEAMMEAMEPTLAPGFRAPATAFPTPQPPPTAGPTGAPLPQSDQESLRAQPGRPRSRITTDRRSRTQERMASPPSAWTLIARHSNWR